MSEKSLSHKLLERYGTWETYMELVNDLKEIKNKENMSDEYFELGKRPFIVYGIPEAKKQFEDAVREHTESLGWIVVNKEESKITPSEERLLNEVRRDDIADDFLQGPISINRPTVQEVKNQMQNDYLADEVGQWDRNLFKKAQLNQASLPSEYPSINNMFQEQVLKPKKNE